MEEKRNNRKTKIGVVVSDKMEKTCVVSVVSNVKHPLYKKVVKVTKKFKVHDENNECKVGDTIEIMETRPISKTTHFRLLRIVEKAK
ncbi:MAG: 30S ribosomal protein S17 [Clostridia bacterium]|nr:30S ribosomal protein S17 [Clostridia bacterium]